MTTQQSPSASDSLFLQHMLGSSNSNNPVVTLLEEIHGCGSINQAAKTVGMSYKAAWEKIENVNNLSPEPLISRQAGGSGGGGWWQHGHFDPYLGKCPPAWTESGREGGCRD